MKRIVIIHIFILLYFAFVANSPTAFTFLIWNVTLALIPYDLSLVLKWLKFKPLVFLLSLIWLIFFPNAMYMITDFAHLSAIGTDLSTLDQFLNYAILASGIFIGVLLGLASARMMAERLFSQNMIALWLFYGFLAAVSAFGIYVGRFLRLNTWDLAMDFAPTFKAILASLNEHSLAFVGWFGILQLMLLLFYHYLQDTKKV